MITSSSSRVDESEGVKASLARYMEGGKERKVRTICSLTFWPSMLRVLIFYTIHEHELDWWSRGGVGTRASER